MMNLQQQKAPGLGLLLGPGNAGSQPKDCDWQLSTAGVNLEVKRPARYLVWLVAAPSGSWVCGSEV